VSTVDRLQEEVRDATARDVVRDLVRGYEDNDLLTYASAIAFQVLFALVPLALFGLGMMGLLGVEDTYTKHIAPELRNAVSPDVFRVFDRTVRNVFQSKQGFWITTGAVITVWEMSGAVRAIMDVFDRIYGHGDRRGKLARYRTSFLLAILAGSAILLAVVAAQAGSAIGGVATVVRWPVVIALLFAAVGGLVHYAPSQRRHLAWVSLGTTLVVAAWVGTSIVFTLYVTDVADYNSIFGNLATVIIVFEYLYLSACAFLTGAQLDKILHDRVNRA
jgi:membrane protein